MIKTMTGNRTAFVSAIAAAVFALFVAGCGSVPLEKVHVVTPELQLTKGAPTAQVTLQIVPEEARVFLDGRYMGRARDFNGEPSVLHVTHGTHVLRFEADKFQNELTTVVVTEEPSLVSVRMLPRPQAPEKSSS
ncbi:MAG: PEGA domain-containing protein [Deltaproteobacteria bacterium]|nr:PEGA domain-containing protein [Deltaproteobacteria bacterium]